MIAHDVVSGLRTATLLLAVAGFALGVVYFASLRRGVHLAIARQAWLPCVAWGFARIAVATLLFGFAVHRGLPAVLAAFTGFLAARAFALRGARRRLA